jgi:hypothetical protein
MTFVRYYMGWITLLGCHSVEDDRRHCPRIYTLEYALFSFTLHSGRTCTLRSFRQGHDRFPPFAADECDDDSEPCDG